MKLQKINLKEFEQNALSFSSLKSVVGGAEFTRSASGGNHAEGETSMSKEVNDYIDDNGGTHFNCDKDVYDDNICG